jgi:hypothetical protein
MTMHRVDAKPRAPLRSSSADTGGFSHPALSDFNIAWRGVLGSELTAYCGRRICELRVSTRTRSPGSKLPMRRAISHIGDLIELKLLEGCLGFQKNLLKIWRTWAEIKKLCRPSRSSVPIASKFMTRCCSDQSKAFSLRLHRAAVDQAPSGLHLGKHRLHPVQNLADGAKTSPSWAVPGEELLQNWEIFI